MTAWHSCSRLPQSPKLKKLFTGIIKLAKAIKAIKIFLNLKLIKADKAIKTPLAVINIALLKQIMREPSGLKPSQTGNKMNGVKANVTPEIKIKKFKNLAKIFILPCMIKVITPQFNLN